MAITTVMMIKIAVIAAAAVGVVFLVRGIRRGARRTINSAEAQIIKELVHAATTQGVDFDEGVNAKRKVSNMNKIYLPMLQKDFPSFNWSEMKRLIEDAVRQHYAGKKKLVLNETAIAKYDKSLGAATITAETSVTYEEGGSPVQALAQTELSYLSYQNGDNDTLHTLNCPNCGAPLSRNAGGEVVCTYCGTAVTGQKDWQITEIKEA